MSHMFIGPMRDSKVTLAQALQYILLLWCLDVELQDKQKRFWLKFANFRLNIEILGKCILHRATHYCWKSRTMLIVQLRVGFQPAFNILKSFRWHVCSFLTYWSSSSLSYLPTFAWVEKEAKLPMSRTRADGGRSKQLVEKITKKMTSRTKITKMVRSQMVESLKCFSRLEFKTIL